MNWMCNGKHFYSLLIPAVSTVPPTGNVTVWEKSTLPTHPCINPLLQTGFSWSASSTANHDTGHWLTGPPLNTHTPLTSTAAMCNSVLRLLRDSISCPPRVFSVLIDHPLNPPLVRAEYRRFHGAVLLNSKKKKSAKMWPLNSLALGDQFEGLIKGRRTHRIHAQKHMQTQVHYAGFD